MSVVLTINTETLTTQEAVALSEFFLAWRGEKSTPFFQAFGRGVRVAPEPGPGLVMMNIGDTLTGADEDDGPAVPATPVDPGARDSRGLPWDVRIHAGTRALNKDGTWRGRKGVDAALVLAVEKELLATLPPTAPVVSPVTPPAADVPSVRAVAFPDLMDKVQAVTGAGKNAVAILGNLGLNFAALAAPEAGADRIRAFDALD